MLITTMFISYQIAKHCSPLIPIQVISSPDQKGVVCNTDVVVGVPSVICEWNAL